MFLLDTDHVSILQRQSQPAYGKLRARMELHPEELFFLSIVGFQEQVLGGNAFVNRARSSEGVLRGYQIMAEVLATYADAQVLPFDAQAEGVFAALRSQKVRIGTMDLRIAAIALSRDFTVLTCNLTDFGQVPGLRIEDWTL